MKKNIIVAVSDNLAIGKDGKVPWEIKEDLRYFREKTMGKPVIMGLGTYMSLPGPLSGRLNIVITHKDLPDVICTQSLEEAYKVAEESSCSECYVIGGSMVYNDALAVADSLYITQVHITVPDASHYFPQLDLGDWEEVERSGLKTDPRNGLKYEFIVYNKK